MKVIEFFSGSANLSKAFANSNYQTVSIDSRYRKGKCEPDLKIDLLKSKPPGGLLKNASLFWFGLPCTAWSNASGSFHIDSKGTFKSALAYDSIKLLKICQALILEYNPTFWVFENPRGRLQFNNTKIKFLQENKGKIYTFSMGSFGFISQKPTQLFTNWQNLSLPVSMPYGRGAKSKGSFSNLTKNQRQSYPLEFCSHIVQQFKYAQIINDNEFNFFY